MFNSGSELGVKRGYRHHLVEFGWVFGLGMGCHFVVGIVVLVVVGVFVVVVAFGIVQVVCGSFFWVWWVVVVCSLEFGFVVRWGRIVLVFAVLVHIVIVLVPVVACILVIVRYGRGIGRIVRRCR